MASLAIVVLPSGRFGYVAQNQLLPLGSDRMCYVKNGAGWTIAGYVSGQ